MITYTDRHVNTGVSMSVTLVCPKHPRYKAIYRPRPTLKHPGGCAVCQALYFAKTHALNFGATIVFRQ